MSETVSVRNPLTKFVYFVFDHNWKFRGSCDSEEDAVKRAKTILKTRFDYAFVLKMVKVVER